MIKIEESHNSHSEDCRALPDTFVSVKAVVCGMNVATVWKRTKKHKLKTSNRLSTVKLTQRPIRSAGMGSVMRIVGGLRVAYRLRSNHHPKPAL